MNTFHLVCEALFEPLVGAFLDLTWTGELADSVHQFNTHAYHLLLFILPTALIIATELLFFIRETDCISVEDKPA